MSTQRKTVDVWEFWLDYGDGWTCDCIELTRAAMKENRKAYRDNCPYPLRIRKRRVRRENLETHDPKRP